MISAALAAIRRPLWARFAPTSLISWGIYNRRRIAGSSTWSQHAWGNAEDLSSPASLGVAHRFRLLDEVYAWLIAERTAGRLPIGTVLWRVPAHFDHIHVEGRPRRLGTPPTAGEGVQDMIDILCELGASGYWVRPFQTALNRQHTIALAGGFSPPWPARPLVVDGRFGELSAAMVRAYQAASGAPIVKAGAIDSRLAVLLLRESSPITI